MEASTSRSAKLTAIKRLNDALDDIEDDEEVTKVVIHPPGDGNISDAESGDEENPGVEHLTRTLLQTEAELVRGNGEEEQHETAPQIKKKRLVTWSPKTSSDLFVFEEMKDASNLSDTVDNDPYLYFKLLWDDNIIYFILAQTRDYSNMEISRSELLTVFGVMAASGVFMRNQ